MIPNTKRLKTHKLNRYSLLVIILIAVSCSKQIEESSIKSSTTTDSVVIVESATEHLASPVLIWYHDFSYVVYRQVEKTVEEVSYELTEKVKASRKFSRSLLAVKDIKAGETFTEDNVRSIRPGYGLHPKFFQSILGKEATNDIKRGTPIHLKHIK